MQMKCRKGIGQQKTRTSAHFRYLTFHVKDEVIDEKRRRPGDAWAFGEIQYPGLRAQH